LRELPFRPGNWQVDRVYHQGYNGYCTDWLTRESFETRLIPLPPLDVGVPPVAGTDSI